MNQLLENIEEMYTCLRIIRHQIGATSFSDEQLSVIGDNPFKRFCNSLDYAPDYALLLAAIFKRVARFASATSHDGVEMWWIDVLGVYGKRF